MLFWICLCTFSVHLSSAKLKFGFDLGSEKKLLLPQWLSSYASTF